MSGAVAEGLAQVRARVAAACARAGRDPSSVELIAVSKLQPEPLLQAAYQAGHRAFGENYAQELRDKSQHLSALPGLRWHFIGPLQAPKIRCRDARDRSEEVSRPRRRYGGQRARRLRNHPRWRGSIASRGTHRFIPAADHALAPCPCGLNPSRMCWASARCASLSDIGNSSPLGKRIWKRSRAPVPGSSSSAARQDRPRTRSMAEPARTHGTAQETQ